MKAQATPQALTGVAPSERPGFFREVRGLLTAAECDALITRAEREGFSATGAAYPHDYRNNDRLVRDDSALAEWLWERVREHLPVLAGDAPLRLNPRFRWCRYRDGQSFNVHRDGAWAPSAGEATRLTVQVYLNGAPEFEGGATRFTESGLSVTPQRGTGIVFDHRLWHEGCAVTRGTKYVLRTDVVYPSRARVPAGGRAEGALREAERYCGHQGYVWSVARAGLFVVSGSRDGTVRRWPGGEVLLETPGSVTAVAVSGDGTVWAGTRGGEVFADDAVVARQGGAVLSMATLRDGRVAVADATGMLRLGDQTLHVGGGWLWSVCEVEPGRLRVGADDGTLSDVDVGRWQVVERKRFPASVRAVCSKGVGLATGAVVLEGRAVGNHQGAVTGLCEVGTAHVASASEDGTVVLWELAGGRPVGKGTCTDFLRSVAPDGQGLVTGSYDGTVRRWVVDFGTL